MTNPEPLPLSQNARLVGIYARAVNEMEASGDKFAFIGPSRGWPQITLRRAQIEQSFAETLQRDPTALAELLRFDGAATELVAAISATGHTMEELIGDHWALGALRIRAEHERLVKDIEDDLILDFPDEGMAF